MADQIPLNFPIPSPDAIATYDFDDIANGFGIVTYYLYNSRTSAGYSYHIGTDTPYSDDAGVLHDGAESTYTWTFNSDTFNQPRLAGGIATLNFCAGGVQTVGAYNFFITIKIYHYDGSTATQLGSTWQSRTIAGPGVANGWNYLAKITVPTKEFKIGDTLRIEVIGNRSAQGQIDIGTDPQNRTWSGIVPSGANKAHHTTFTVDFPYKI